MKYRVRKAHVQNAHALDPNNFVYAVPLLKGTTNNDLLVGCWHEYWDTDHANYLGDLGKTFYITASEHDWVLFKIANGIMGEREVEIN